METMKQSGLWCSLGTHGSVVVIWWLCISSSREIFSIKFYLAGQGQLHPHPPPPPQKNQKTKNNRDLNQAISTSDPNLVILAWMGNELWCGQAQYGVNVTFKFNLTLKVKVNSPQNNMD